MPVTRPVLAQKTRICKLGWVKEEGVMEGFSLKDALSATKGEWVGKTDPETLLPTGGSIDTRSLKHGNLFFALPGERVDGHQFLGAAFNNGAMAAIVSRKWYASQSHIDWGPLIVVDAPDLAMGDVARNYRKHFHIPVIGITGSTGKTTTKDMAATVLGTRYNVLATEGNLNNHLGVPLMMFRLSKHHQVAVIEMGISKHNELRYLCEIAQPTIGIITNIGPTHLEFLGSVEGVAKAKGELLEYLDESSMTILNLDDLLLSKERAKVKGRLLGFGIEQICQFRGEGLNLDQKGCSHFSLQGFSFHLPIPGRHNVYNALAAAAAGSALHISLETASEALAQFTPSKLRSQELLQNGITLINDAYNANPASMRAAIDTLASIEPTKNGRRIAVLGDMLELGDSANQAHRELGAGVAAKKIDHLFALGPLSYLVAEGAQKTGMSVKNACAFTDRDALIKTLTENIRTGDVILAKGSRGLAMEQVIKAMGFVI